MGRAKVVEISNVNYKFLSNSNAIRLTDRSLPSLASQDYFFMNVL